MKPDWNDAPEWARYVAQDGNGAWYWYENKPTAKNTFFTGDGKFELCKTENPDWLSTVEERPIAKPEPEAAEDIEF